MSKMDLNVFQQKFPQSVMTIQGAVWSWRDTKPRAPLTPIVFLPGAGGNGDVFYGAVAALDDSRRIITVNYPALYDVSLMVSGLAQLMTAIGVQKLDIVGSSLGGYIAQALAINHPDLVSRLLLGNTFYDASWLQAKISREAFMATPADEHMARTIAQLQSLPAERPEEKNYKETMLAIVGTGQTAAMAHAYLGAVLGTEPLNVVKLAAGAIAVLDAEDDMVVDKTVRDAVRARYPDSVQYHFQSGGHYPSLLNPAAYYAAIYEHFVRNQ